MVTLCVLKVMTILGLSVLKDEISSWNLPSVLPHVRYLARPHPQKRNIAVALGVAEALGFLCLCPTTVYRAFH